MSQNNVELDNRIYNLQKVMDIPEHLHAKITQADILYLQDKNEECICLLEEIENEILQREAI